MDDSIHKRGVAADDLRLLTYVQHMLQTARSEPAKREFELFLNQEKQRMKPASGMPPLTGIDRLPRDEHRPRSRPGQGIA